MPEEPNDSTAYKTAEAPNAIVETTGATGAPTQVPRGSALLTLACLVIVVAGARAAEVVLVPFLLALFIAIICGAPISELRERGMPGWMAASSVGVSAIALIALMVVILGSTAGAFMDQLPGYQAQFDELIVVWVEALADEGIDINMDVIDSALDPAAALNFFGGFLNGLGEVLSNLILILFTVIFILADAPSFAAKVASGNNLESHKYLSAFKGLSGSMNDYIVTKAMVSVLTGGLVWLGLTLLGAKFALLWGFLAFLLNFIPNIGSVLAAVPAVLLSLLEQDPLLTGGIIFLYLAVNTIVGNVIEPRWMGQKVGLSTLTVFLSLVFWGWMFGPVGMFLSVPLTMSVKFVATQSPRTAWLSVLLSNDAPADEKKSTQNPQQATAG